MEILDLGLIDFVEALSLQHSLLERVAAGGEEAVLLLEHPSVYTIGSGGDLANSLDPELPLLRINRGGDVTWHGPGQLVCYPILDLGRRGRDLHRYLRLLETLLLSLCDDYGVAAFRINGKTGVWTEQGKLAAIGVGVRRWVTMHGFSLNVAPDLNAFQRINPCGMLGCPVTSLRHELAGEVSMDQVKQELVKRFASELSGQ
jgi:lipoyl(octanoyl) transferase